VTEPPLRIAGKASFGVLDHLRREIDAQHIRAAMSQLDGQHAAAATGIENAPAAQIFGNRSRIA
jgi:hypothetical protein